MHFRIAEQRIIPFLLQLIVRGSCEDAPQNLDFAYKAEEHLRPHSALYTQFEDSPPLKSCICV